jgi:hypothetical protein
MPNALASILFPAALVTDLPAKMGELLERAKHQAGHDWHLTAEACAAIRAGNFPPPSQDAFFTGDELLAYAVANPTQAEADYRAGVLAMLIAAHGVAHGFGDAEFVFPKALRFFAAYADVDDDCRMDDLLAVLHLLRTGHAPHISP